MQFYKHPFIDLIAGDPFIRENELYIQSKFKNKEAFLKELHGLIADNHLEETLGIYCPATIYLRRILKSEMKHCGNIFLKYVSFKELQVIVEGQYIEDSLCEVHETFGYRLVVENIAIEEKHQLYFENLCDTKLDMERYLYILCAQFIDPDLNLSSL